MCSSSLVYLLDLGEVSKEEVTRGLVNCPTSFWTFTRFGRKVFGIISTGLFPELTLKKLVFLHRKYYYISAATGS
jgi:hypothetical protein